MDCMKLDIKAHPDPVVPVEDLEPSVQRRRDVEERVCIHASWIDLASGERVKWILVGDREIG
jgi:hypothetical protein